MQDNKDQPSTTISTPPVPQRQLPRSKKKRRIIDTSGIIAIAPPESLTSSSRYDISVKRLLDTNVSAALLDPQEGSDDHCLLLIPVNRNEPMVCNIQDQSTNGEASKTLRDNHDKDSNSSADVGTVESTDPQVPAQCQTNVQAETVNHKNSPGETQNSANNDDVINRPLRDTTMGKTSKKWYDNLDMDDLEAWIVEELDRIVCRAEEKEIMKQLDCKILKEEEEDVMETLLHQVRDSEDLEYVKSMPRRVENLTRIQETTGRSDLQSDEQAKRVWNAICARKRKNPPTMAALIGSQQSGSPIIKEVETTTIVACQQKLPKWVPHPRANGGRCRLFTRSKFWKVVVDSLYKYSEFQDISTFEIILSECSPDDSDSYLLEAKGTKEQMEKFRILTERYVQTMIEDTNIVKLWKDSMSLLLDVPLSCDEKLGAITNMYSYRDWKNTKWAIPGVWIHEIETEGALCRAVGSPTVFESGCMIVAVDGKDVFLPDHIKSNYIKGRESLNSNVMVTLCFSKHSDFSKLSKCLLPELKRRNRKPYELERFEGFIKMREKEFNFSQTAAEKGGNEDAGNIPKPSTLPTEPNAGVNTSSGVTRYDMFVQKYRPLVSLEFRDTKIHQNQILASMWDAHKTMFGADSCCDNDCTCFKTTSNMVDAAISKNANSSVDGAADVRKKATGVLEYFLPRFIDRLKEEYPQESTADLFQRVMNMWSEHQGNRLYGLLCEEKCQCEQEWDQLFGRGDQMRSEAFKMSTRKKSWRSSSTVSDKTQEPLVDLTDSDYAISGQIHQPAGRVNAKRRFESETFQHAPEAKRQRRSAASGRPNFSRFVERTTRTPFEAIFDSSIPMGGYFVTGPAVDGVLGCHLFSTFQFGAIANDARIRLGATVSAIVMGDSRVDVCSHVDLKRYYEQAKQGRKRFHLIIENRGGLHGLVDTTKNWSTLGNWIGARKDGWPGGAKDESERFQPATTTNKAAATISQPTSIHPSNQSLFNGDPLWDAVRIQSCRELIQVLENGFPQDREEVEQRLIPLYDYVRCELKSLEASISNGRDPGGSVVHRIQDWRAKYIALKICRGNVFEIEKAASLKAWNVIEFRVECLKLETHRATGLPGKKVVTVSVKTKNPDAVLVSIFFVPMQKYCRQEICNRNLMPHSVKTGLPSKPELFFLCLVRSTDDGFSTTQQLPFYF
jgi:hypothetical protein